MYNDTDITYSFNLDNYINSLESNYSFNDYKILVNNKDYNTLSIEHERLMNEVNAIMNNDMFSTEGIGDMFSKFISWFKDMIQKLINLFTTFIKRIIAKIYELTLKSKNDIWKKYKGAKFSAVNIQITDYPLRRNTNIMKFIDEFLGKWTIWAATITEEPQFESMNSIVDLSNLLFNVEQDEQLSSSKISDYFHNMFYETSKTQMDIKYFFDCKKGETPNQIELLSDEYKDSLIRCKKNAEQFLKKLKSMQKTYIDYLSNNQEAIDYGSRFSDGLVEPFKRVIKNITLLHNINYTFFIEVVKLRNKIAKYILKASLGGLFDKLEPQEKGIKVGEINYYSYREPCHKFIEELDIGNGVLKIDCRGTLFFVKYKAHEKMNYGDNSFVDAWLQLYGKLKSLNCLDSFKGRAGNMIHRFKGDKMGGKLISFKDETTALIKAMGSIETNMQLPFENFLIREVDIDPDYGCNFSILYGTRCMEFDKDKDILYHTSDISLNSLSASGITKEGFIYSEPRIYVALNEVYDRIGGGGIRYTDKKALKEYIKNSKSNIYKLIIPNNITLYSDPEIGGSAGYILANNVQVENMTNEILEYIDS